MKKIAIIDDEVDFCTLVQMQCKKAGMVCRYANSIKDGLTLVNDFIPDIVILDNNLPDGFGWSQASMILNKHPHVVLHLVTAKTAQEVLQTKSEDVTSRLFLHSKPLSIVQLHDILA